MAPGANLGGSLSPRNSCCCSRPAKVQKWTLFGVLHGMDRPGGENAWRQHGWGGVPGEMSPPDSQPR